MKRMNDNIEIYLVRQGDEDRSYLYISGSLVLNYQKDVLESLSEDSETLELMDSLVFGLKEQNSDQIKLVPVNTKKICYILELGRKVRRLYESSQKITAQRDPKKKEQLKKTHFKFQRAGRDLMDIIKRDIEKEGRALENFDKMTDSEIIEFVDETIAKKDY